MLRIGQKPLGNLSPIANQSLPKLLTVGFAVPALPLVDTAEMFDGINNIGTDIPKLALHAGPSLLGFLLPISEMSFPDNVGISLDDFLQYS
jgi:hypothetical protein